MRDLFLCAKYLFVAAMAEGLLGGRKRPHPQAGGRVRTGPRWAERIKLDPPYSAGGSNVGGENILATLGPIPLGRSALVRGFTPDICLFAPEICLMEPHVRKACPWS